MQRISNCTLSQLDDLAKKLSKEISAPQCITLNGNLGAGKTTFAKMLILYLTQSKNAASPTFNIVQLHQGKNYQLWHCDLYRLKHAEELHDIDFRSMSGDIMIVEWPEIAQNYLPKKQIKVTIEFSKTHDTRDITVEYID